MIGYTPPPNGINPKWSTYSKVRHRLQLLDSPGVDGWTPQELAIEYGVTVSRMERILSQLVKNGHALITNEGGYIGS